MHNKSWHNVILEDKNLLLRPICEQDWALIHRWSNDPEVLYFSDGPGVTGHDLDAIKYEIFRAGTKNKFCFMIIADEEAIGECWLQKMNLDRIQNAFPREDLRRVDLSIGEKSYWGKGFGTRTISLLTALGFQKEGADRIFGCSIGQHNPRSLRAFIKNGYEVFGQHENEDQEISYDLFIKRSSHKVKTTNDY